MSLRHVASEFLREGQRHHFAEPPNELAAEKAYRWQRSQPQNGESLTIG